MPEKKTKKKRSRRNKKMLYEDRQVAGSATYKHSKTG